jgi:hypothetical protein
LGYFPFLRGVCGSSLLANASYREDLDPKKNRRFLCRRLATFFDFRQTYAYLNSICREFHNPRRYDQVRITLIFMAWLSQNDVPFAVESFVDARADAAPFVSN